MLRVWLWLQSVCVGGQGNCRILCRLSSPLFFLLLNSGALDLPSGFRRENNQKST